MLCLFVFGRENKTTKLVEKDYGLLLLIDLIGASIAPFVYFNGLELTSASNTSILTNGEMIFTVLIAMVFIRAKLSGVGGYFGSALNLGHIVTFPKV